MSKPSKTLASFLLGCPFAVMLGCGDSMMSSGEEHPMPDMMGMENAKPRCELPYDVRAIDKVATGAVAFAIMPSASDTYNAQIDATAGDENTFGENPFVYVDLVLRKKVEISDVQAQKSTNWDIAFKRWQIKINGGDSGPGYTLLSRVDAAGLADVTDAPSGPYHTDAYFDSQCGLISDWLGGLGTALSDWYDYDMKLHHLVPKKEVIVLTRRDGQGHIKLQLNDYYKGDTSGYYSLTLGYLP